MKPSQGGRGKIFPVEEQLIPVEEAEAGEPGEGREGLPPPMIEGWGRIVENPHSLLICAKG